MGLHIRWLAATYAFLLSSGSGAALAAAVTHEVATVHGLRVDRYSWPDSKGLVRTVSLKQEGNGNPGHGGYAVQMTYQLNGGAPTVTVDQDTCCGDGGFGYFVSHERFRDFTDGDNNTIAAKIFGTDDSPLGLDFPAAGTTVPLADPTALAHVFTTNYGHYGTTSPIPKNANGDDVRPTPTDRAAFAFYNLPLTIAWVFQAGIDYPRIDTAVSLADVTGPDLVNFDLRGPYGVMIFDNGTDGTVTRLMWGDRFHFVTTRNPPVRNSSWTWNKRNKGARYSALAAGAFEMGLFEPRLFTQSATADLYADERGSTSAAYNNGHGCAQGETELLPCDFEWPYQSLQYSLPFDNNNANTSFKKMAWGSTVFYGTGPSLPQVSDTAGTVEAFDGFPNSGQLAYSVCVVLGPTTKAGLTKTAAKHPDRNCASAPIPPM